MSRDNKLTFECLEVKRTDKAVLVEFLKDDTNEQFWFPLSLVEVDDSGEIQTIEIPEWVCNRDDVNLDWSK